MQVAQAVLTGFGNVEGSTLTPPGLSHAKPVTRYPSARPAGRRDVRVYNVPIRAAYMPMYIMRRYRTLCVIMQLFIHSGHFRHV